MIMVESTPRIRLVDDPSTEHRPFLPGMGKAWLMPLYDPFTRLVGANRYRAQLISYAQISPGQRVLDVGCGSGDLLIDIARTVPGAELSGLDPDGIALGRAARKATRAGTGVTLIRGYADHLPFDDASLDHVVSSLAIHHLDDGDKARFAAEARRVLRPGGKITILDFGGSGNDHAHGPIGHLTGLIDSLVRKNKQVQPNLDSALPELFRGAGFADAKQIAFRQTFVGPLTYVQATR
jgi:ubiquinone/menaquinone biosynthesis C-methylase UbiE